MSNDLVDSTKVASPVIVALDSASINDALTLADSLDPMLCRLKVGKELFNELCNVDLRNGL